MHMYLKHRHIGIFYALYLVDFVCMHMTKRKRQHEVKEKCINQWMATHMGISAYIYNYICICHPPVSRDYEFQRRSNLRPGLSKVVRRTTQQVSSFHDNDVCPQGKFVWQIHISNSLNFLLSGTSQYDDEGRPSKLLHYWERPECWEGSWRLEKTCCHSNSSEKPSANANVKNSQEVNNNNNNNKIDW